MIEADQSFLDQRRQKLDREEWIAGRLLVHHFRQRGRALLVAVERIRNQPAQIFAAESAREISWTSAPALRIASSLRISGWADVTSLSR